MARLKRVGSSPAIVVAVLALVAGIGGTALAGSGPTANTAGKALKKAKRALKIAKAADKEQGPQGEKGENGANGATDVTRRISVLTTVTADDNASASVNCEPGERAVGGGGLPFNGITADFDMTASAPLISGGDVLDEGVPIAGGPATPIETSTTATRATFFPMRMPSARPRKRRGLRATSASSPDTENRRLPLRDISAGGGSLGLRSDPRA